LQLFFPRLQYTYPQMTLTRYSKHSSKFQSMPAVSRRRWPPCEHKYLVHTLHLRSPTLLRGQRKGRLRCLRIISDTFTQLQTPLTSISMRRSTLKNPAACSSSKQPFNMLRVTIPTSSVRRGSNFGPSNLLVECGLTVFIFTNARSSGRRWSPKPLRFPFRRMTS
jgi:hypothetical protein